MSTLLLFDDAMTEHDPGAGHPECPDRLRAIADRFARDPVAGTRTAAPRPVERAAVERVHPSHHVQRIYDAEGKHLALDPDTHLSPGSIAAARLAAGAAVDAVDAVMKPDTDNAFAFVRPPGHHALADRSMGFCVLNNVAIAAEHARQVHGLERVLIVDWDVHHGNGTQAIFYDRSDVLFMSSHQFPFYPGTGAVRETGAGAGTGFTVNVPYGPGARDADLRKAFTEVLHPVAEAFEPDLVLVSAGFDGHRQDPLGQFELSREGFADLCGEVRAVAERHAHGRLVMLLEGGYDLQALAGSAHACAQVLAGASPPDAAGVTTAGGEATLRLTVDEHRARWLS